MNFMAKYKTKPRNAPPKSKRKRIPRSTMPFVPITELQAEKLLFDIYDTRASLFLILQFESLRHFGKPFILPTDKLITESGLGRRNLGRILTQLESRGLISITRRPSKPPLITVL
jgi:hypothetical protein